VTCPWDPALDRDTTETAGEFDKSNRLTPPSSVTSSSVTNLVSLETDGRLMAGAGPILCVVGARPNYMKMAPLLRALSRRPALPEFVLVHTGQHYDPSLNDDLFRDLELPPPLLNLGVGSGSHAAQTAEVMLRIEPVMDERQPCCLVVVGDVNSTLACSLVAVKKGIPVAHVEAGLRSFDTTMPEEINRVVTDRISSWLYTTEDTALDNLLREGVDRERIVAVGNVMIDSLLNALPRAPASNSTLAGMPGVVESPVGYALATLHRPSNVDSPTALQESIEVLAEIGGSMPVVWPIHPRTRIRLDAFGLQASLSAQHIHLMPPASYLAMVGLMRDARVVLTDSGGIQEETTALGVPCLTMRENTERPVTIFEGTNTLIGRDRDLARACVSDVLSTGGKRGRRPLLWDGHAAERIAYDLVARLDSA
jgi:UDP-N-acetylglucosamine 2-epimerase (non-hydrolysing)